MSQISKKFDIYLCYIWYYPPETVNMLFEPLKC